MRRTAVLWLFPALLVAGTWLRLEEPRAGGDIALGLALALTPALLPRRSLRALAALPATLLAAAAAFGVSPLALRPFDGEPFFGAVVRRAGGGLRAFYDVGLPFEPRLHPDMAGLVVFAVFAFALALALAIAERRPLAACAVLAAGAGWPATLLGGEGALTRGGLILGGVLVLLAGLRGPGRALRPAVVAGMAVLLAALAASTSPTIARGGLLEWQAWNPYEVGRRIRVDYVWRGRYSGIDFPDKPTTVFEVEAPNHPRYWRSTTLDTFDDDVWDERLEPLFAEQRGDRHLLLVDPTLAQAARAESRWVKQRVEIEALGDERLPGASVPVAYEVGDVDDVLYNIGGVAEAGDGLERGDAYTVWSYAVEPSPRVLARLPAAYPEALMFASNALVVWPGRRVPPFSTRGRDAAVRAVLGSNLRVAAYEPLYRTAKRVVGNARTPYLAAVALETWFRRAGGFTYDESPPQAAGAPALAGFVTETRRGYCQHFAGAMALMLRYLGVPARVAAGFTTGNYDDDRKRWVVEDTDAHTWVEVWFPRFGWLPFDPTPGRGTFDAPYTNASLTFDAVAAAEAAALGAGLGLEALRRLSREQLENRRAGDAPGSPASPTPAAESDGEGGSLPVLAVLGALAVVALSALGKAARRRLRYLTSDPRRLATACRRDLAEFVADQRVEIPPDATLAELAELVRSRLGINPGRFVAAASAARFGPPERASRAAAQARRELRAVRRALRRRLTVGERLRGVVSLRSLRPSA
ncbi:MAG: hypothetical protein ICV59_05505 [Thermoleophilia bacterium]|nr:hypothetical protein [Thermoleophilia bacterium]